jgi:tetratricopeptide (TPR) repeat protein
MDTITAQRAMQLAKSYIDEVEDSPDPNQWKDQRHTLMLAARQLNLATQADPEATLEDGDMTYTIPMLRARMLYKEALTWDKQDYNKAVHIAKKAAEADPNYVYAHHMLAIYHWDRREKNQALASIDRVLELEPNNIEALKLRDRIQSLTTAERAVYKTTDIAATTFNITRIILTIILLPVRIVLFPLLLISRLFLGK